MLGLASGERRPLSAWALSRPDHLQKSMAVDELHPVLFGEGNRLASVATGSDENAPAAQVLFAVYDAVEFADRPHSYALGPPVLALNQNLLSFAFQDQVNSAIGPAAGRDNGVALTTEGGRDQVLELLPSEFTDGVDAGLAVEKPAGQAAAQQRE